MQLRLPLQRLLPLLTRLRLAQPVGQPYKVVILWGGLRGAVTLVLATTVAMVCGSWASTSKSPTEPVLLVIRK